MKAIILAAGKGERLAHLTKDKPKCLVEFNKKPIINYILDVINSFDFNEVLLVAGYKKEIIQNHLSNSNVSIYVNEKFDKTNMVSTLFTVNDELDDDIIISYADIIYSKDILAKLISSDADISVIVDKNWKYLWETRMNDPLSDAETMKIDKYDNIIELGKTPNGYQDIEGQYIGLIKISKNIIHKVKDFYYNLDRNAMYDGKNFDNMYMTTFIQLIINKLSAVKAIYIHGGWVEIDTIKDLDNYTELLTNEQDTLGLSKLVNFQKTSL